MDEAQLSPEQTVAIQQVLKQKGFLPANEVIDGVFGPTTRAAIGDWQRRPQGGPEIAHKPRSSAEVERWTYC
jgi:hypothetical protein